MQSGNVIMQHGHGSVYLTEPGDIRVFILRLIIIILFLQNELISFFLDVLTINDIQMLVESEDEVERKGDFQQIFPNLTR